ncbi:MAG TPA: 30S ribosomal protein S6 [Polyangiaceae bacterium]|nr:30S ribosomal protein S6 [Polyangiaceae bacterium]
MATAQEAHKRAREYETIYVLRQDVDPDTADKVATRVADVVGRESGKLVKVETWGRRKLAYTVAKQRRGIYYYLKYLGGGAVVTELERNLRMLDNVLKFQTVLLRDDVQVDSVTVDPEEVKFARLEPPPEDEKEESREKALGLVDAPEEQRSRSPEGEFPDDLEGIDGDDWTSPKASAAPASIAAPAAAPETYAKKKEEEPS